MKQIVVISGKGGTGKTVLTGSFAALAKNSVIADCDVDAADLHLLLQPRIEERHPFKSGATAVIDQARCRGCLRCAKACHFEAISSEPRVDPISCEGCGFCYHLCPANAIQMVEKIAGEWFISTTRFGSLVHAKLGVAEENSGKLVSLVRNQARKLALDHHREMVIIDGAPGIGCPVIACIADTDCAVVITEPTLSGLHDARRVIEVAHHFGIPVKLVINKFDLNEELTAEFENYARATQIAVIGKIPFDPTVVQAVINGQTIVEASPSLRPMVENIWQQVIDG